MQSLKVRFHFLDSISHFFWVKMIYLIVVAEMVWLVALRTNKNIFFVAIVFNSFMVVDFAKIFVCYLCGWKSKADNFSERRNFSCEMTSLPESDDLNNLMNDDLKKKQLSFKYWFAVQCYQIQFWCLHTKLFLLSIIIF